MVKPSATAMRVRRPMLAVALLAAGLVVGLPMERASAAMNTTSAAFGAVPLGQVVDKTITVTNTTGGTVVVTGVPIPTNPQFSLVSNVGCLNVTLAANGTCSVVYRYAPTSGTSITNNLTITANPSTANTPLSLTGTGVPLSLSSPSPFGTLALGQTSTQTLDLKNIGSSNFTLTPTLAASAVSPYSASLGTCVFGLVLAPGTSCHPSITFAPSTAAHLGPQNTTVSFTVSSAVYTVPVSGSGKPPLSVSLASNDFGTVALGSSSTNVTVTISNFGTSSFTTSGFTPPATSGGFVVSSNTCNSATITFAPGGSCSFQVKFQPQTGGPQTKDYVFATHGVQFGDTSVSGYGSPFVAVSASANDFGSVPVGGISGPFTVTLTNNEASQVTLTGFTPPATSGPFLVSSNTCNATSLTLSAGGSCSYVVRFQPSTTGPASVSFGYSTSGVQFGATAFSGTGVNGLAAAPTTLNLGSVEVGSTGLPQSVVVTNTTGYDILVSGALAAPLPAEWQPTLGGSGKCLNGDLSAKTLLAGQTCTVSFVYMPNDVTDLGAQQVQTTLQLNGAGYGITLNATGLAPLSPNPTSLNVGPVPVGFDSAPTVVNVYDTAPPATGPFGPLTMTGGAPVNPAFTMSSDCDGHPAVTTGGSCQVTYTFKPRTASDLGLISTASTFTVNGRQFTISLFGTGVALSVPASLNLGDAGLNGPAKTGNLVLTNNTTVAIGPITATPGAISPMFSFGTNGCAGATLAAGTSCSIQIAFAPTALGAATGTAALTVNGLAATVNLSGNGVNVSVPASLDAGPASINGAAKTAGLVVTNSSATTLGPLAVTTGSISGPFAWGTNGCDTQTLAPSTTCTIQVAFSPTTLGAASGTATVTVNGTAFNVALSGSGVNVSVPSALPFGDWGVNGPASDGTIVISNPTGVPLGPLTVVTGAISPTFTFGTDGCTGHTLAPSTTCALHVLFAPTATGAVSGSAAFTVNGQGFTVNLSGNGVASSVLGSIDFGQAGLGDAAKTNNIVVTNTTGVPLGPLTVVTGSISSSFAFGTDGCTGSTLNPGQSCTVGVTFAPTALGTVNGSASLTVNGIGYVVSLTGFGVSATVPASLDFGTASVGNAVVNATLTLSNASLVGLGPLTVTVGTPSAGFSLVSNGCSSATLAVSGTCPIQFSFAATAIGPASGSVQVTVNGLPTTVSLTGIGAGVTVGSSASFGVAGAGDDPVTTTVQVSNGSSITLGPLTVVTGAVSSGFSFGTTTCSGASLAPAGTCTIQLKFAPTSVGPKTGTASLTINGVPYSIDLSGTGVGVTVPASLVFGSAGVGDAPLAQTITLTNNTALTLGPLTVVPGTIGSPFSFGTDQCTGHTLAPSDTCTLQFKFAPTTLGPKSGTAQFTVNGVSESVDLSGTSVGVSVPSLVTFPDTAVNAAPTAGTITVSNGTSLTLGPLSVSHGAISAGFSFTSDTCATATLAPGDSCTVGVQFAPTSLGAKSGTAALTINGVGYSVNLSGTSVGVTLPAVLAFGSAGVNDAPKSATIAVKNLSGLTLGPLTVVTGAISPLFSFDTDGCSGETLLPTTQCLLTLTFAPTSPGAASGTASVTIDGVPYSVNLTGTGVTPTVPSTLAFGDVAVNGAAKGAGLVVTNNTSVALGPLSVTVGSPSAGFAAVSDGCSSVTLAIGDTCTLGFSASATTLGALSGSVTVTINGIDKTVNFSGTGVGATVPGNLDFGDVAVNGAAKNADLVLTNASSIPLGPLSVVVGTPSAGFTAGSNGCLGVTLAVGDTCTVSFSTSTSVLGVFSGSVVVTVNGIDSTVNLSGTGVNATVPASLDFGDGGVNLAPKPADLVLSNDSTVPLGPLTVDLGAPTGPFSVTSDDCVGVTLDPGDTCAVHLAFTPPARSAYSGSIAVTVDGILTTVALSGHGVAVTVPFFIEFGRTGINSNPTVKSITVSNDSSTPLGPLGVVPDPASPPFAFAGDGCSGITLQPGASCLLSFQFAPTVTGDVGGAVLVTVNGVTYPIGLHGQAAPAGPSNLIAPTVSAFGASLKWTFPTLANSWILTDQNGKRLTMRVSRRGTTYGSSLSGLKPTTRYCYTVSANLGLSRGGETAPSNQVCLVTPVASAGGQALSKSSIKVRFKGTAGQMYSLLGPNGRQNNITAIKEGSYSTITITGLQKGKSTCWQVIAVVNGQDSPASSKVCVRTRYV